MAGIGAEEPGFVCHWDNSPVILLRQRGYAKTILTSQFAALRHEAIKNRARDRRGLAIVMWLVSGAATPAKAQQAKRPEKEQATGGKRNLRGVPGQIVGRDIA